MAIKKLKVSLLENTPFLNGDGTFNLQKSMMFSGHVGGICYNEGGLMASFNESDEACQKRINFMAKNAHQSVFEHVNIGLYIKDAPKIFDMVLNNEGQYQTSERSLRYTPVKEETSSVTNREVELYDKWFNILKEIIEKKYGNIFTPFKIKTLAQENARYMTSVFVNTEMVHTIPLVQLNRILSYMDKYEKEASNTLFKEQLVNTFHDFYDECIRLNLVNEEFFINPKNRSLRLFNDDLIKKCFRDEFGENYSVTYTESFAALAHSQRHRTIHHAMELGKDNEYGFFIPEILKGEKNSAGEDLEKVWLKDINSVKNVYPQGQKVLINERGTIDDFIEKMKERECTVVQFEIWRQTEETRREYLDELERKKHLRTEEFKKYTKTMRCGFPTFNCPSPCNRANLKRDI